MGLKTTIKSGDLTRVLCSYVTGRFRIKTHTETPSVVWFVQAFWSGAGGLASLGRWTGWDTHNLIWKPQLHSYVTGHLGIKF